MSTSPEPVETSKIRTPTWLAGVLFSLLGAALAVGIGQILPAVPVLTIALLLGLVIGQTPAAQKLLSGAFAPGMALSARRLLRIGIVLLGLKLSLGAIAELGWEAILLIVVLVALSFLATWAIAKLFRLPGQQPLMLAAGFSICGVSAIGAMSSTTRAKPEDTATPIAMVTLFGSLGILVLPSLASWIGISGESFGVWVGASLHDVGQVVAAGQTGGAAALAIAVTVKLTRVVTLAPMVAIAGVFERRRHAQSPGIRPPIVPLFIVMFIIAVLINSLLVLPPWVHSTADGVQTILFGAALFAIGCGIRLLAIARAGARAVIAGSIAWAIICVMALAVVWTHAH